MNPLLVFLLLGACGSLTAGAAEPDIVVADFEGKDYGEWQTTGAAFGPAPARGTLPNQMPVSGFAGQGLVNSFYRGDDSTGTLTSPEFNADQIVLTDRKPNVLLAEQKRDLVLEHRYLNLPVKNGAAKRRMSLLIGGRAVREFEIELADAQPDFWVFLEVTPFKGQAATLRVDKLPENSEGLKAITQGETIQGAEDLYRETLRPQFHFSSRRGWNNDPNGLVYYQGEYHLFYQHNPYGWDWGNMHWGHAVSPDLVHWQELPIAIYPQRFGDWAFSGSAVVDWKNSGGFRTGQEAALVAAYTSTDRGEAVAYSNDRGRTWTEFSGNPVVKHSGRDPRLLWHEPTHKWVMAVYDELDGKRWIACYNSPDLKTWEFQSRIEGFYECPDLFELPVDGHHQNRKWVLTAASSEYLIGAFDGKKFTPETAKLPGHRGNAFYAAQTYSDIPPQDGRCIQIGWGQMAAPGMPFNQMMTFPCELKLRTTPEGVRLCFQPVKEIEKLHTRGHHWKSLTLKPVENPLASISGELLDIRIEFETGNAGEIGFNLRGVAVVYDAKKQTLACQDRKAPLPAVAGKVRLQILVDRTSLEIFGNDGLVYMPMRLLPKDDDKSPALFARGGSARISSLQVFELNSAWPQP
ncbi:MAG: GH32 C-terminal domain-containing protein [Verrucomicrobiota bacterium]